MAKQANSSRASKHPPACAPMAVATGPVSDESLIGLARQLASVIVCELRAQLNGDNERAPVKIGGEKTRMAKERAFQLFKAFDQLPDDAYVPLDVLLLLESISRATAYRRIRAGILPQPECRGGAVRFRVGALRAARAVANV